MSKLEFISTGIKALDDLLMGGIVAGSIIQLYGTKSTGKTLLATQLAYNYMKTTARNVMYIDTELGFSKSIGAYWRKTLNNRFNICPAIQLVKIKRSALSRKARRIRENEVIVALEAVLKELNISYTNGQLKQASRVFLSEIELSVCAEKTSSQAIFTLEESSLTELLKIHGIHADIRATEGGRVEIRMVSDSPEGIDASPIAGFVSKHNIGMVIYDSISAPIKATFLGTQDLPARSSAINMLMSKVEELCSSYNVTALVINHESTAPLSHRKTPYANTALGYRTKYILQIQSREPRSKTPEGCINPELSSVANRVIRVARHPKYEDYSKCSLLVVDDNGFKC